MKYLGFVALLCIFQCIRFSFACYGYTIDLVEFLSGPENNVKFENDIYFELTNECRAIGSANLTIDRPFTSVSLSLNTLYNDMDIFTLKNLDFCKFISDYHIIGFSCTSGKAGRVHIEFGEKTNFIEYGPFIGLFAGNLTVLLKAYFDGDKENPDIFALLVNIRKINGTPLVL